MTLTQTWSMVNGKSHKNYHTCPFFDCHQNGKFNAPLESLLEVHAVRIANPFAPTSDGADLGWHRYKSNPFRWKISPHQRKHCGWSQPEIRRENPVDMVNISQCTGLRIHPSWLFRTFSINSINTIKFINWRRFPVSNTPTFPLLKPTNPLLHCSHVVTCHGDNRKPCQMSRNQKPCDIPLNPGSWIGILIMAWCNPLYKWVDFHPLYSSNSGWTDYCCQATSWIWSQVLR